MNKVGLNDSSGVTLDQAKVATYASWLYARYFVGNSFAITSGVGYRNLKVDFTFSDTSGRKVDGTVTASSVVIPLALGNHWTFANGLEIGCDWISAMLPITGTSSATASSNFGAKNLQDALTIMDDLGKTLAKIPTVDLATVSLGYAF